MTDQTERCCGDLAPSISVLSQMEDDIIRLQAMIEGIDVVADLASVAGDGVEMAEGVRRARNSLPVLIEAAHNASEELLRKIGAAAVAEKGVTALSRS